MRNILVQWLIAKARLDPRIILLTADLGYSVLEKYLDEHPKRFLNVGVAEQNMAGVASGLAMEGFLPYTYSIGIFPTFRCAEQIRNDIDYHCLPVVTCSIGSGVAYGNLGYSHHAIQDLSLMRSLPNMVIATPSDPADVASILDWHYRNPCPMYLRLHKAGEPMLDYDSQVINIGLIRSLTQCSSRMHDTLESQSACIIVIGFLARNVLDLVKASSKCIPVFSLSLWGQPAREEFLRQIQDFTTIITVEDHVLEGGLAAYVMESLALSGLKANVLPVALDSSVVGSVASESTLLDPLLRRLEGIISTI
jgi:transketolase